MNQVTQAATAPAAQQFKYVLLQGRHNALLDDGTRREYVQGDELLMTEAQAAVFVNKFARVVVPTKDLTPVVQAQEPSKAPPAAPTIKQLEAALAALPACIDDSELVYEDAKEAWEDFARVFGELMHDGYTEQIEKAFASVPKAKGKK